MVVSSQICASMQFLKPLNATLKNGKDDELGLIGAHKSCAPYRFAD